MMNGLLLILSLWLVNLDEPCQTKIQRLPEVRQGIMIESEVLTERFVIDGKDRVVSGVWIFQGIDPDDKIEMSTSVYANRIPIVLSSPHKETLAYYDAWRWFPNYVKFKGPVSTITIDVTANVTGENNVTPRPEGKDTARPHWGVWILWECAE